MRPEVFDFWAEKDLQIQKLVRVGRNRHQLPATPIQQAAEYIYNNRNTIYKDTWINAWLVFQIAREIDYEKINENQKAEAKKKYELLDEIEKLKSQINKKKLRYRIWNWFTDTPLPYWE